MIIRVIITAIEKLLIIIRIIIIIIVIWGSFVETHTRASEPGFRVFGLGVFNYEV